MSQTTRHPVELIFPDGDALRLEVGEDEHIWDAASQKDVRLPSTCLQGWCLTCAGKVLEGEWDQSESLRYYPEDREGRFILLCTASPRSPMRIQTHQKPQMRDARIARDLPAPRG